jgi:hypothetical protein
MRETDCLPRQATDKRKEVPIKTGRFLFRRASSKAEVAALESKLEARAKAEKDELKQEMERHVAEIREQLQPPPDAISEGQLSSLQARLQALHAAQLLSDDELYGLEDLAADYLEFRCSAGGVVTVAMTHVNEAAGKLLKLVALSEGTVADAMFARQARRKYVV